MLRGCSDGEGAQRTPLEEILGPEAAPKAADQAAMAAALVREKMSSATAS